MHHALQIQEILFNIFGHCYQYEFGLLSRSGVAALARTCRAFKEPALDVLWEELIELSPLVRCIPKASHRLSSKYATKSYAFHRSLTQIEWDILRSYTRRIRSINLQQDMDMPGIDHKCFINLLKHPMTEPLFSNVRKLRFQYPDDKYLLLATLPSLMSLSIRLIDPRSFEDSLRLFAKISPSLANLFIFIFPGSYWINMDRIDPKFICHLRNLQSFSCSKMLLDMTTLVHLSRLPALIDLSFTLRSTLPDQISPSDSPLIFSNLDRLVLRSEFLRPVSHLLSKIRLPAVTDLAAYIDFCPTREELSLFFANVRTSGSPRTIQALRLIQPYNWGQTSVPGDRPVLGLEDLRLYVPFSNLRRIQLAMEGKVDLTDSELLTLVSTWPCLKELSINTVWGWNTLGGITPNGLLQLLHSCPLLTAIALAIDTRGEIPPSPTSLGFLPPRYTINFIDSFIEEESVPAIAAFIASLVAPFTLYFHAWYSHAMKAPYRDVCLNRWKDVQNRVRDAGRFR
ncbi:hypothetical protein L210DRAFT_3658472 [Boletus edulis BED1]|uniref:F-box domain-containing protein n=1 Tax=Boletus edulis BED1 TaxID=1328754 RepID=A0AAD4G4M8_BOLED|nr:hypothetical protein L210DRAFT_3658472 [Boletus edulis BED1]